MARAHQADNADKDVQPASASAGLNRRALTCSCNRLSVNRMLRIMATPIQQAPSQKLIRSRQLITAPLCLRAPAFHARIIAFIRGHSLREPASFTGIMTWPCQCAKEKKNWIRLNSRDTNWHNITPQHLILGSERRMRRGSQRLGNQNLVTINIYMSISLTAMERKQLGLNSLLIHG